MDLKEGQYLKVSGFPNLNLQIRKIIGKAGLEQKSRITHLEIALRYINTSSARLLDLKLPRVRTIVDILHRFLGYLPASLTIRTDDDKLFANLEAKEMRSYIK